MIFRSLGRSAILMILRLLQSWLDLNIRNILLITSSQMEFHYLRGKNVQNGKLVLSFESYIPKSISDELPRSQIAKKCLLTPYVGTIGNIAIFDGSFKAHLGSNVGKIELLNSDIQTFVLEEYVLWYLKSTYGYAELTKHKKATAQESISIDAIRNVIIAIPPLEEQYRIVAKIEELLPLCDRLRK